MKTVQEAKGETLIKELFNKFFKKKDKKRKTLYNSKRLLANFIRNFWGNYKIWYNLPLDLKPIIRKTFFWVGNEKAYNSFAFDDNRRM